MSAYQSTPANPTFSLLHLQVYQLSLASNKISRERNTIEKLQSLANDKIAEAVSLLGWTVVWGPVVWKNDPDNHLTGPDHVWFVARPANADIYVISVAGTATIYNHIINNVGIAQVVDFMKWSPNTPPQPTSTVNKTGTYVAFGTAQGVHILSSYPAPTSAKGAGETLPNFLKGEKRRSAQFIFTGFSLGGALSPTLALALTKAGELKDAKEVLTFPIAAPSCGNVHYATLFETTFREHPDNWNANVANELDVVPQAWSTDSSLTQNLGNIPKIYGNDPALPKVERKINRAKDAANKSGIVYIPLRSIFFTPRDANVKAPNDEDEFLKIAQEQHSKSYLTYFVSQGAKEVDEGLFPDLFLDI